MKRLSKKSHLSGEQILDMTLKAMKENYKNILMAEPELDLYSPLGTIAI